jgi:pimeloyl-ACP methyl ester carboxylesterase/DNA-binding CsgD family transcriptional regulator
VTGRGLRSTCYAQSVNAKIAYQVSGIGTADLVLVSGLVSHVELAWQQPSYRRFVSSLERRCRVIRFDKRGTGLSDPTDSPPTIDVRVADLAAVMDAAKVSAAVLLGVSDGGRGAVGYAASYPERVAGLILYGTSYRGPRADLLRRYRAAVRHWGEGRLFDVVAPSLVNSESRAAAGAFERAAASPAMVEALVESLGLADIRDCLGMLRVPTLVLHREHDIIPLADARVVADRIPGSRLQVLPGFDHVPWAGDWVAVVEAVLGFVDQTVGADTRSRKRQQTTQTTRRDRVGWTSLTEAERQVVALAAQGLSNADIANALLLSRFTVETHLKHVFTKLAVRSRAELASLASEARARAPNT